MRLLYDQALNDIENLNEFEREEILWLKIEQIANNTPEPEFNLRSKRQQISETQFVSVLKPVVLSPFMFTPAIGPVFLEIFIKKKFFLGTFGSRYFKPFNFFAIVCLIAIDHF